MSEKAIWIRVHCRIIERGRGVGGIKQGETLWQQTLTILTGLRFMVCPVRPLRKGGSSSTSSTSKFSSEEGHSSYNEMPRPIVQIINDMNEQ